MYDQRIAVFSDIHSNLTALEAILSNINSRGITERYCLGDFVDFAPWPNEVISRIRHENIPSVYGNHDQRLFNNETISAKSWHSPEETNARRTAMKISSATVTDENLRWLKALPFSRQLSMGDKKILLVHASPDSIDEYLRPDHPEEALRTLQQNHGFDILISGHTHLADVRYIKRKNGEMFAVVNTGAVGRIKEGEPQATWLELTLHETNIKLTVHRVNYDVSYVAKSILSSDVPDFYARDLLQHAQPVIEEGKL